tara:strand:+ start:37665 stop:39104 length:1440 start_codon:yes stop_codon:yes gene_type:complete
VKINFKKLNKMLNPKTVVVVGEKGPNYQFLSSQLDFKGNLYSVQIDKKEIPGIKKLGVKNFASLDDIPGQIDLLIVAVPRQVAPFIAQQAIKRNVKGIHFFTAGFEETKEKIGIDLQNQLTNIMNQSDIPVIGPNCMGIYNKNLSLRFHPAQNLAEDKPNIRKQNLSFLSQSGTHGVNVTVGAQRNGINVARAISFGNALFVNECDLLEYLIEDKQTDIIAFYLEGVKDGSRFIKLIKKSNKPVLVWKGGRNNAGARAVASHTASMASNYVIWQKLIQDSGGINVTSLDELTNVAMLLNYKEYKIGESLALITMTGGQSVAITDAFEDQGFVIPQLTKPSYKKLSEFFNVIGGSYRNPFDAGSTIGNDVGNLKKILKIIGQDKNINGSLVIDMNTRIYRESKKQYIQFLEALNQFKKTYKMPVIIVVHALTSTIMMTDNEKVTREAISREVTQLAIDRGLPVFNSFNDAAKAMRLAALH